MAVVELLDDLREQIWRHYALQLQQLYREDRVQDNIDIAGNDRDVRIAGSGLAPHFVEALFGQFEHFRPFVVDGHAPARRGEHDTPARMAELRRTLEPRGDWRFLTAQDPDALAPVLRDYGQDVVRGEAGSLGHVLKVFLVDETGAVRNIYSAGLLAWQLVLNDIRTVLALFQDAHE